VIIKWGSPNITRPIYIDKKLFFVTVNLWQVLFNLEKWEPLLALHLFSGQAPFASTRQMMMNKRPPIHERYI
jgi:hypothetical protein